MASPDAKLKMDCSHQNNNLEKQIIFLSAHKTLNSIKLQAVALIPDDFLGLNVDKKSRWSKWISLLQDPVLPVKE